MSKTFQSYNIPWPFNPDDEDSFQKHFRRLRAARRVAKEHPLESGLLIDCTISIPPESTALAGRALPPFASTLGTGTSIPITLRLIKPYQTKPNMWSQVWTAVVLKRGSLTPRPTETANVVLKLVQPSMCKLLEERSQIMWHYKIPERIARHEAEFYEMTKDLQGGPIPYFFGLHPMTPPSGEASWALLLEYIEGPTLYQFMKSTQCKPGNIDNKILDTIQEIYEDTLDALGQIHQKNLFPNDVSKRNIILSASRTPVFIDFASALYETFVDIIRKQEVNYLHIIFQTWPGYGPKLNRYHIGVQKPTEDVDDQS